MTTQNLYALTDLWNSGGTTFTGIGLSVTDTASASGSLLMDLQVGGSTKFNVSKDGRTFSNSWIDANVGVVFGSSVDVVISSASSYGVTLSDIAPVAWTSGNAVATQDLFLRRDAANTLAQRNGVNAQAFRVYNTYTDASNYERGKIAWDTNVLKIGTEKAGTGTARALELQTDGTTYLVINTGASPRHSFTGGNTQFSGNLSTSGDITIAAADPYTWSLRSKMFSPSDGDIRLANNAGTDFGRLQFGGTTSSFPSLKRSSTTLQARLADDSAFAPVQGKLTTETAYTAGDPVTTGYLTLYDSNGTAYKVPAVAA
jgi:hypothetical protein